MIEQNISAVKKKNLRVHVLPASTLFHTEAENILGSDVIHKRVRIGQSL